PFVEPSAAAFWMPSAPAEKVSGDEAERMLSRHALLSAKHPAAIVRPRLKVDVAVPVCAKLRTEWLPATVDVAVEEEVRKTVAVVVPATIAGPFTASVAPGVDEEKPTLPLNTGLSGKTGPEVPLHPPVSASKRAASSEHPSISVSSRMFCEPTTV